MPLFALVPNQKEHAFGKTDPYPLDLAPGTSIVTISYAADAAFRQVFGTGA
jgi:hypothetical protein